jgi:hypothetical protein
MLKRLLVLIPIILPISVHADNNALAFYLGLHGNTTWSTTIDEYGTENIAGNTSQRIDNGDTVSTPSFLITAGLDKKFALWGSKNFQVLFGTELFFDYINKTMVQGSILNWMNRPSIMNNKPIYKTNFLTGLRAKLPTLHYIAITYSSPYYNDSNLAL